MSKRNKKLKLPRGYKRHPLLVGLRKFCESNEVSVRQVAIKHLGVTQQALDEWLRLAAKDRNFILPAARVPDICRLTEIAPYWFNPVLWPNKAWRFK